MIVCHDIKEGKTTLSVYSDRKGFLGRMKDNYYDCTNEKLGHFLLRMKMFYQEKQEAQV